MKIKIRNIGVLRQAEFTLGDLTIICGGNNTGKTYATYALFGFLYSWRKILRTNIGVHDDQIIRLLAEGAARIDIEEYVDQAGKYLSDACKQYTTLLPAIFASKSDRFKEAEFQIIPDEKDIRVAPSYEQKMRTASAELLDMKKKEGSSALEVTLLVSKEQLKISVEIITEIIGDALKEIVFGSLFPNPFIASSERTGAAIFRNELDFARNRLLEQMSQAGKNVDPVQLLLSSYRDYALPVKTNVDFTRQLERYSKNVSFIGDHHPELLKDFSDIIDGEYGVTQKGELIFQPRGKRVKLSMDESSSAVRSLLDIGFYLKHVAQRGDLLMVDEPELNLHPENQRRVARLFARLVNVGIKVFMTTHSDYIIKELNTLIMLNHDKPYLKEIAEREGYKEEELLSSDKIKVYIAEQAHIKTDGGQRKTLSQTLTPASIDPEMGIEARSFDKTIDAMNRIQEEIVWGGE